MIRLAIRFDDPSATSNRALEQGIFAAAEAAGMPITVGVIPFRRRAEELIPLTQDRATHLIDAQNAGIIEVALHGYCHETVRGEQQPPSEFMGLDVATQIERIREGRDLLAATFGCPVTGFVPPWNTFDLATVQALTKLEFRYISAGMDLPAECDSSLTYLPRTCQIASLAQTINEVEKFTTFDPVVIAVMHHYDFVESGIANAQTDLKRFGHILQTLMQDKRIQATTVSALCNDPVASSANRQMQNAWARLPGKIQCHLPKDALLSQGWQRIFLKSIFRLI